MEQRLCDKCGSAVTERGAEDLIVNVNGTLLIRGDYCGACLEAITSALSRTWLHRNYPELLNR